MVRTVCIDLLAGPGRFWRLGAGAAWLLTALVLVGLAGRIEWPWVVLGALVLAGEWPGRSRRRYADAQLRLYRDGSAELNRQPGRWQAGAWSTGWFTVLSVEAGAGRRRLPIMAWRNPRDNYRVLRCWLRHPVRDDRFQPQPGRGRGE